MWIWGLWRFFSRLQRAMEAPDIFVGVTSQKYDLGAVSETKRLET